MNLDTISLNAEKRFIEALDLIDDSNYVSAIEILVQIIDQHPKYGKAYSKLGWIYDTKLNDLKRAEECYLLALQYAPNYRNTYYHYAVVLSVTRRYDELCKHLEVSKSIPGINMSSINNEYGIMHETQGNYLEAIECYQKSIQHCFSRDSIKNAANSIERCEDKLDMLHKE